jgi:hypothetical protein
MSLGAVIKRHKRTLINFQESFLIPFVTKAAHRYMQFEPELYPVSDYKFEVTSSLGIIAREYEVTQLVQLLQTMSPESPLYPALIQSIIDNMNLSNREQLIQTLQQAGQPSPEQQQAQQAMQQAQMAFQQSQTNALNGQAAESEARAVTSNLKEGDKDDKEFERRLKIADSRMKEQKLNIEAAKVLS